MPKFAPRSDRQRRSRSVVFRVLVGAGFLAGLSALGTFVVHLAGQDKSLGLTAGIGLARPLQHDWQLQRGKHWQIASTAVEPAAVTDGLEGTRGECPAGMVHVHGEM